MSIETYATDTLVQSLQPRYPRLIAEFARIPDGARHLRRLVELDQTWVNQQFAPRTPPIVVSHGEIAVPSDTPTFDIVYAGGGLNLLNAAVMSGVYGQHVLVFDRFTVGAVHREWNISLDELQELIRVGLLQPDEVESIIHRRYRDGLVHFHGEGIPRPQTDLWMDRVLDVAVDADALTALCIRKIQAASPANVIRHGTSFLHATVGSDRVVITIRDEDGTEKYLCARLLIDGMGATSPIACQLNCGAPYSLVCPTVGTVAGGYVIDPDRAPGTIDPDLGEILITTEHARDGHQLIWEAFPGRDDQVAIYLFYYAETGADRRPPADASILLPLFEEFFTLLPSYKDTSAVVPIKPVYGFIPAGYKNVALRRQDRKVLAYDRVLSLGDAAAMQSPLTFCGFGSNARNLRRITTLMHTALLHDRLRATDLRRIRAAEATPALARAFSKFMIAKPEGREPAWQVNETFNVFCGILDQMGPRIAREFFQDRVRWWDYTRLLLKTAVVYPKIFALTARTLSGPDVLSWIAAYGAFTGVALRNAIGRVTLMPLSETAPGQRIAKAGWRIAPGLLWQVSATLASLRQSLRIHQD